MDYEGELAVVIGKEAKDVRAEDAMSYVYGFTVCNDLTARDLQKRMLEEAGVAVIGGPDFGVLGEGYIRLSYANSAENISRALKRMEEFLASARP